MMIRQKPLAKQHGADIVEFIVTLPFVMILFFMIVGFGVAMCDWAVIANASRAAAREAIRNTDNTAVYNAANAVLASLIIWKGSTSYTCNAANCPIVPSDRSSTASGADVSVTVSYTVQFPIPWLSGVDLPLASVTHMSMLPR